MDSGVCKCRSAEYRPTDGTVVALNEIQPWLAEKHLLYGSYSRVTFFEIRFSLLHVNSITS